MSMDLYGNKLFFKNVEYTDQRKVDVDTLNAGKSVLAVLRTHLIAPKEITNEEKRRRKREKKNKNRTVYPK